MHGGDLLRSACHTEAFLLEPRRRDLLWSGRVPRRRGLLQPPFHGAGHRQEKPCGLERGPDSEGWSPAVRAPSPSATAPHAARPETPNRPRECGWCPAGSWRLCQLRVHQRSLLALLVFWVRAACESSFAVLVTPTKVGILPPLASASLAPLRPPPQGAQGLHGGARPVRLFSSPWPWRRTWVTRAFSPRRCLSSPPGGRSAEGSQACGSASHPPPAQLPASSTCLTG